MGGLGACRVDGGCGVRAEAARGGTGGGGGGGGCRVEGAEAALRLVLGRAIFAGALAAGGGGSGGGGGGGGVGVGAMERATSSWLSCSVCWTNLGGGTASRSPSSSAPMAMVWPAHPPGGLAGGVLGGRGRLRGGAGGSSGGGAAVGRGAVTGGLGGAVAGAGVNTGRLGGGGGWDEVVVGAAACVSTGRTTRAGGEAVGVAGGGLRAAKSRLS